MSCSFTAETQKTKEFLGTIRDLCVPLRVLGVFAVNESEMYVEASSALPYRCACSPGA
jgi:hypothetical protein